MADELNPTRLSDAVKGLRGAIGMSRNGLTAYARMDELQLVLAGIERMRAALTGIATMDCHTRPGEEPAHVLMMRMAREALGK